MKRILALFLAAFCLTAFCLTAISDEKEYSINPTPGNVYFIRWIQPIATSSTLTLTNQEDYIYCPAIWRAIYKSATISTVTVDHVAYLSQDLYLEKTTTTTNEFGSVFTNFYHSVTGNVTVCVTNRIGSTEGTASSALNTGTCTEFIQRNDLLIYTFTPTNVYYLKITGKR